MKPVCKRVTALSALLIAPAAVAQRMEVSPSVAQGVPVDSPWLLAALAATVAVVGARIFIKRRK
ncbi:MAG: hypothetical protein AAGI11_08040 [Pseudomonadota bacterium]